MRIIQHPAVARVVAVCTLVMPVAVLPAYAFTGTQSGSPSLSQATDITNQQREFATFLDENGKAEEALWVSVRAVCRLTVGSPQGTGFTVGYRVETTNGSVIMQSLMGTNHATRTIEIPPGNYRFVAFARREAGYYRFPISTTCD